VLIGTYTTGYSGINAWADLTFRWRVGGLAAGGLMNRTSPALADVSTFLASPSQWTQVTFGLVRNIGAVTSAVGLSVFSVASLPPVNEVFELAGYDDGGATTWAGGHAANTIRATVTYVLFDTSLGRFV